MTTTKPSYSEVKDLLDACPFFYATNKKNKNHKYKYFDITRPVNQPIKDLLIEFGYYKFAPTRSMKLVSYHQIIAFFFVSPKKQLDGNLGLLHIHHLSGNTLENHPSNLVYLTPEDHSLVTKFQRKASTFKISSFYKLTGTGLRTWFNSKGERIKNWAKFILGVIALTVAKTYNFTGFKYVSPPKLIMSVVMFATRFVKRMFNNLTLPLQPEFTL
jgi:hypothetical protein